MGNSTDMHFRPQGALRRRANPICSQHAVGFWVYRRGIAGCLRDATCRSRGSASSIMDSPRRQARCFGKSRVPALYRKLGGIIRRKRASAILPLFAGAFYPSVSSHQSKPDHALFFTPLALPLSLTQTTNASIIFGPLTYPGLAVFGTAQQPPIGGCGGSPRRAWFPQGGMWFNT